MSTLKGSQYIRSLDAARCNGEWDQVPELCRKVKKHAPGRKCLVLTALAESKLTVLGPPPQGPSYSAWTDQLTALQDSLQAEIDTYTLPLPQLPAPAGGAEHFTVTEPDILQARILIAWILSLKREWGEVLNVVPGEDEVGEGWEGSVGKSEYMDIMRIKALVLKGMALSHTNTDQSLPLQVYRAATRLHASFPPGQSSAAFSMWAEKSLAFYALATYHVWLDEHMAPSPTQVTAPSTPGEADGERTPEEEEGAEEEGPVGMAIGKTIVDESTVASAFREFHSFISGATGAASRGLTAEKLEKRKEVYRYYFKFLSFLLLPHGHPQRPMTEHPGPRRERGFSTTALIKKPSVSKAGTPEKLQEELKDISKIYESYLMYGLKFPKAEDYHESIGEWVDQVVENWRVSGGSAEDAAPVVEILYRASKKSFHSPRILRHLFHTLTATGNFTDAIAALDTYLCLMQNAMDRISKGHDEKDYDQDKVAFQTAVEGIRVLCKYTGNGQKAMEIASRIEDWVDRQRIKDKEILADIYRGIGIANAAFSRLTSEGELRPGSQQAAVDAFKKGLSYDPVDPQGWYGLALVEAEMRSVDDAMESARKGLGALKYTFLENADANDVAGNTRDYKRFVVPILHLLALLMTAKEDFDNAELVCKNAFDIVGEGREAVSDLGVTDKVAIFELMMTQLAIVEVVEDSETATTMAEQLLGLYGTLFDGTHLVQRQQVGNSDENNVAAGEESNPSSRPGTTASRRSRLFGRSHKKQFSASYSSLAPIQGQLDPTASTQSQGGTIRKRAKSDYQSQPALLPPPGTLQTPPKIQVTDTQSGASAPPSEKAHHRKLMRPSSLSSGTVRRMRSLGSLRLRNNEPRPDDPPTPPLPCSTEASSLNFDSPTGSLSGKDPYLFHILKNKLHTHHQVPSTNTSAAASAVSILQIERTDSPIAAESLPHNLPAHKLPYPLGAISRSLAENTHDGLARNSRRPVQLPEPKLAVDEEQKQVLGALRKAWICVSGLYRRAGFFNDAYMATQEAMGLVGADGEGEADVLAERGFLELSQHRHGMASELFDLALGIEYDHPQSIVGLSKLLLDVKDMDIHPDIPAGTASRPGSRGTKDTATTTTTARTDSEEDAGLDRLAGRNRALGLLEKLVVSPRGWDLADAWFLLADALEKSGEVERARYALWRVVELEDGTGVRGWRNCGVGVV